MPVVCFRIWSLWVWIWVSSLSSLGGPRWQSQSMNPWWGILTVCNLRTEQNKNSNCVSLSSPGCNKKKVFETYSCVGCSSNIFDVSCGPWTRNYETLFCRQVHQHPSGRYMRALFFTHMITAMPLKWLVSVIVAHYTLLLGNVVVVRYCGCP